MASFFGRVKELKSLADLRSKNTSSLVCVLGRRRIGKSSLIAHFGEKFPKIIKIQGLGPEKASTNQNQLDHFAETLSIQCKTRKEYFTDWTEAFFALSEQVKKGTNLILLDEISWMGKHDPLFSAKLKDAWDLYLKNNPKNIVVVCGSVSSWIEENILLNTNFEGRISLTINLEGLQLSEINHYWNKNNYNFGTLEKMLALSVAGGVPKYLEEILKSKNIEKNIIDLCFTSKGMLFNDFKYIFSDIFDRKKLGLEKIVRLIVEKKLSTTEIANKLKKQVDNDLSEKLHILELSGFTIRDYYFKPDGTASKLSHIRLKDNYLRFYLKYIEPNKARILTGGKIFERLFDLKNFESILGLQFENVILANRVSLYPLLEISNTSIISAAPYVQNKTAQQSGCQIDLLIHTELDVFYLCELKCKKLIDNSVIKEVRSKVNAIKLPKRSSVKPVLIYEGEIYEPHRSDIEEFFYRIISFSNILDSKS